MNAVPGITGTSPELPEPFCVLLTDDELLKIKGHPNKFRKSQRYNRLSRQKLPKFR